VEGVVVRQGTVSDVGELAALRRAWTFEDSDCPPRSDYERAFTRVVGDGIVSGRWAVWLAEIDGAIVSHAFVGLIDKIPGPTPGHAAIGYLTNVYTRPEFRGRGIGGAVLDAVAEWARDEGIELLVVWPSKESVTHYERHGFANRGEPLVWLHPDVPD
jgi:GNAT superfamily N-acetyltransferase